MNSEAEVRGRPETFMAMEEEVKLIAGMSSPFSWRVEWALKLKGVQYERIEENVFNKSPLLLQYNPVHKKVPVLLHAGKPIAESLVILEYIEETWKSIPILPENPYERATARFWANFVDDKVMFALRGVLCSGGEEQGKYLELTLEALRTLDEELKGKSFFGGETIGFVDLAAGWMAHWFNVGEEVAGVKLSDPDKFASLHGWMDRFLNLPIIKQNLPPRDVMLLYFRTIRTITVGSTN